MMGDEFVEFVRLTGERNGRRFVIIGNGLKRELDKTKENIASLEETIVELQNEKLKLTS